MANFNNPRKIATTVTTSATLGRGFHTPVDATAGAVTMTLPTNAPAGIEISVEKIDASTNAVTISGTIRSSTSTLTLNSQYEARTFLSEGSGSWRPISDHRTATSLSAAYVGTVKAQQRDKMARTLAALRSAPGRGIGLGSTYPTTSDVPTVAHSTTDTVTASFTKIEGSENNDTRWTFVGNAGVTWNTSFGYLTNNVNGQDAAGSTIGFVLTGTDIEVTWRSGGTTEQQWIWVDGKPITGQPAPVTSITVGAAGIYRTRLTFATSGVRRIEFHMQLGGLVALRIPNATSTISPLSTRGAVKFFALGDSYLGGSALIPGLQTWGRRIAFACGMTCFQGGQGGTGYVTNGTTKWALTDSTRLSPVAAVNPDVVVIFMGGNDSASASAVQTAAAQVFSTIAASCPSTPVIVAGCYPSSATNTKTAVRATTNKAVRDAALAAPNVLGFIDPIGHADLGVLPASIVNGQAYNVGDRYEFNGSIFRVQVAHTAGTSPTTNKTECLTWLTGTGNVASPVGDGNRDTLLSGDSTHWTLDGAGYQAARLMDGMEKILVAALEA